MPEHSACLSEQGGTKQLQSAALPDTAADSRFFVQNDWLRLLVLNRPLLNRGEKSLWFRIIGWSDPWVSRDGVTKQHIAPTFVLR
jgi:hypothetical protein